MKAFISFYLPPQMSKNEFQFRKKIERVINHIKIVVQSVIIYQIKVAQVQS